MAELGKKHANRQITGRPAAVTLHQAAKLGLAGIENSIGLISF
jgi:hypothetical protein